MNPIGSSRARLSSSPIERGCSPGPLVTQEGLGRPGVSLIRHLLCHEFRDRSVVALINADPPPMSYRLHCHGNQEQQGRAQRTNYAKRDTAIAAESGTATREIWSLSPTGFYSRSPQPAAFGCRLPQADIGRGWDREIPQQLHTLKPSLLSFVTLRTPKTTFSGKCFVALLSVASSVSLDPQSS
jgi:hypothetical protein